MSSAGIGRLLVASLHQAISERLPERLAFYEPWLTTDGFRTSRVSVAGIRAAFSFLRLEDGAYDPVMQRAGALAASWIWLGLTPVRRGWLRAMPAWLRRRAAVALTRRLSSDAWGRTKSGARWRGGEGRVRIRESLFCDVRTPVPGPLCTYYAAGLAHFLEVLEVPAAVRVDTCRAVSGSSCEFVLPPRTAGGTAAAVLLLLVCGGSAGPAVAQPAPADGHARILVMPFDAASRDPRLSWLGEGVAELLVEGLRSRGAAVIPRDERLQLFDRLQIPPAASLSRATVIRLGEVTGAAQLVIGRVERAGDDVALRARRIDLVSGVMDAEVTEHVAPAAVMDGAERLLGKLGIAGTAGAPRRDGAVWRPSLAAFEQYITGLRADTPEAQLAAFTAAMAAEPRFDAVRLALWQVHTGAGRHTDAMAAVRAVPEQAPLHPEAQFRLALSLLQAEAEEDAVGVLKALHERAPSAAVLNNLGVAVGRRPALAARAGKPAWFFSQARVADPVDADHVFNLGYAYWVDGDPSGAVYWLKECVRLDPTDAAAHALLAQALHAAGQAAEAYRELSLAQRLSSAYDGVELKAGMSAPSGLARLKDSRDPRSARRLEASLTGSGPERHRELAAFHRERGLRLAERELDLAAEGELARALYFDPYDAQSHLALGRIYLRSGRLDAAVSSVKVSLWREESAAAHLVLAEAHLELRDFPAARGDAERALALDPNSVHARQLLERLPR